MIAATVPNCRAYDPGTAAELAIILAMVREMLERRRDVFFYVTVGNENQPRPFAARRCRGGRRARFAVLAAAPGTPQVRLWVGALLREVQEAARLLREHAASRRLERDQLQRTGPRGTSGRALEPPVDPQAAARTSHLVQCLAQRPIIAASDRARLAAVDRAMSARRRRPWAPTVSAARTPRALRRFFEVDRQRVAVAALAALARAAWSRPAARRSDRALRHRRRRRPALGGLSRRIAAAPRGRRVACSVVCAMPRKRRCSSSVAWARKV